MRDLLLEIVALLAVLAAFSGVFSAPQNDDLALADHQQSASVVSPTQAEAFESTGVAG